MNLTLFGIVIVSFFGSLSMFTLNVPWKDITFPFRKDKKKYLEFSNAFRGRALFIIGCLFFVVFIIDLFVGLHIPQTKLLLFFLGLLIIVRIILEIRWRKIETEN